MRLAIAMTTAPRPTPYIGRAFDSLRGAGFAGPVHVFLEPDCPDVPLAGAVPHQAAARFGCFPNWKRALAWTTARVEADFYLMLQDDVVWRPAAAAALERLMDGAAAAAGFGFASPYTSPAMVPGAYLGAASGQAWVPPAFYNRAFWGALALLFSRESAAALLRCPRFIAHDHHRKLDVVVGHCMRDLGRAMLVAVPSLCDHIGEFSTLGRHLIRGNQWARRGYRFDPGREGLRDAP
jgi:hypothetical protein